MATFTAVSFLQILPRVQKHEPVGLPRPVIAFSPGHAPPMALRRGSLTSSFCYPSRRSGAALYAPLVSISCGLAGAVWRFRDRSNQIIEPPGSSFDGFLWYAVLTCIHIGQPLVDIADSGKCR
jgi:hypothetical protein